MTAREPFFTKVGVLAYTGAGDETEKILT